MRLSASVSALLFLFGAGHVITTISGFSLQPPTPVASATKAGRVSSLLFSAPVTNPTLRDLEGSGDDDEDDILQSVLSTLGKRLDQGPGALSFLELEMLKVESQRLLDELGEESEPQAAAPAPIQETISKKKPPAKALVPKKVPNIAPPRPMTPEEKEDLRDAVMDNDATRVSKLLDAGLHMDEELTEAAFWAVVQAVDVAEANDKPLSADLPKMLHHIFDADLQHLLTNREQIRTNLTCMQPDTGAGLGAQARRMNYIFDDAAHKDIDLMEGRCCEDGACCDTCSRNVFPTFASEKEIDFDTFPGINSLTFNELTEVPASTIIQFTRLVERVRRTIAYEYGLPLNTVLPLQAYSRKYVAGTTQKGGGGGEGDFVTIHTDESTHSGYHYSCVMYLSTHGEDFEGGAFVFNDPAAPGAEQNQNHEIPKIYADDPEMSLAEEIRRAGRTLTPFYPTRGAAVIFSSGWENMHEVEKVTKGIRYAVPCFFTTCPVPEAHYDLMVVGKPKTDEDIADDWLHLLLAHRDETPMESTGRVKELMMKWHHMCTPLTQH